MNTLGNCPATGTGVKKLFMLLWEGKFINKSVYNMLDKVEERAASPMMGVGHPQGVLTASSGELLFGSAFCGVALGRVFSRMNAERPPTPLLLQPLQICQFLSSVHFSSGRKDLLHLRTCRPGKTWVSGLRPEIRKK